MPSLTTKCEQLSIKLEELDDHYLPYNELEETIPRFVLCLDYSCYLMLILLVEKRMHLEPTPARSITDPVNISIATPGSSRHGTPIMHSMPQPQATPAPAARPPDTSVAPPSPFNRPEMTYRRSRVVCEQTIPQNQPGPSVPISRLTFPNGKAYYAAMVEANSVSDQEWFDFQQLFAALGTVRDILRTIFIKEVDMRRMEREDVWESEDVQEDVRRTSDGGRGQPHDVRARMRPATHGERLGHSAPLTQSTPHKPTDGPRPTTSNWSPTVGRQHSVHGPFHDT